MSKSPSTDNDVEIFSDGESENESIDNQFSSKRNSPTNNDSFAKSLVSHLPDQIVCANPDREMPYLVTLQGVLMFLDISGFTSLTEKYSMNAKNGIDQLTKTLNGYMSDLVNEIITSDGDIIKFAGDAILTLWKVNSFSAMKATVGHVVQCAMNIQQKCGEYSTSVGVTLRVKIGIAAGEVMVNYLGNEEFCHYVTMGRAVESVNLAEKFCVSGDVVISPSAWVHCAGLPVHVEILEDGKHRKVLEYEHEEVTSKNEPYEQKRTTLVTKSISEMLNISLGNEVRRTVIDSYSEKEKDKQRLYIAPPVLKKIDVGQPLEYLSEVRQVTIVFINLVLRNCTKYEVCQTLQSAFQVIYGSVKKVQGLLNKVFMFDKGSTFLAIFGLPGFKHDNDCARALQCSHEICVQLTDITNILRTSIGVTTGPSYCGVVGHQQRHEYTVIGRKVNMAARLMMAYGGKVTCDNETYHHSKLQKANFIILELMTMKGLQNIGTIREFKENKSRRHTIDALLIQEIDHPLIGRGSEIENIMSEFRSFRSNPTAAEACSVIVLNGPTGIGRSRLLEAIIVKVTQENIRVVFFNLHMEHLKTPYYAVKQLLMDLLDLEYDVPHQEREHALFQQFTDPFVLENLSLLNDFLHLKLPLREKFAHMQSQTRNKMFHDVLFRMVHEISCQVGFVLFAVDDAQYMDHESWQFIEELGNDSHSLVLLTLKTGSKYCQHEAAKNVLDHQTTKHININGLESEFLAILACQVLGVVSIAEPLESLLIHKSQGVPSWCEQLLYSMLHDEMLSIVPWFTDSSSQIMVTPKLSVQKSSIFSSVQKFELSVPDVNRRKSSVKETFSELFRSNGKDPIVDMICIVAPEVCLSDVRIPESIKGVIQARIDKMEELDQLIIKSASVIGEIFPRKMLQAVLPKYLTLAKILESLIRLSSNGILQCGYRDRDLHQIGPPTGGQDGGSHKYICHCPSVEDHHQNTINECHVLQFKSSSIQETAYEMYTEALRRDLHIKAAKYLESEAHKCTSCGGGNFVPDARSSNSNGQKKNKHRPKTADMSKNKRGPKVSTLSKLRMSSLKKTSLHTPDIIVDTISASTSTNQGEISSMSRSPSQHPRQFALASSSKVEPSHTTISSSEIENFDEVIRTRIRSSICEETLSEHGDVLSPMDVRECKCTEILLTVLPQLVRHWKVAGNVKKHVHSLMESGAAAISTDDNMQALAYLQEVSYIIHCYKTGEDHLEGEISQVEQFVYDRYTEARCESLIGQALYHMGMLDESIPHFHKTLVLLGCAQPTSKIGVIIKVIKEGFIQWKHHKFPRRCLGSADQSLSVHLIEQARCLSHIYNDYQHSHYDRLALLAVLQQLNKAELVNFNSIEVLIAYTSMMEYCQNKSWHKLGLLYEMKAQHRSMQNDHLTAEDHISMAHLLCTSLSWRLATGQITGAIESGSTAEPQFSEFNVWLKVEVSACKTEQRYTANKIIRRLHDNDMRIQMLPILAQALILANRVSDAVEVLCELEYLDEECDVVVGKTWYHACCIDLLLETGVQLEPIQRCETFASYCVKDPIFQLDKLPMFFLSCGLALCYQRKFQEKSSSKWKDIALDFKPNQNLTSFVYVNSRLKLTECMLIGLAKVKNYSHAPTQETALKLMKEIKKDFKFYKKMCKKIPVLQLRCNHLHAYFKAICASVIKARKVVHNVLKAAEEHDNNTELIWIRENEEAWSKETCPENSFWTDDDVKPIDWHAVNSEEDIVKFVLPLPKWFI